MNKLMNAVMTLLRGIAKEGEKPPFFLSPMFYVGLTLAELIASILLTHLLLSQQNPWLYPFLVPIVMLGQAGVWGIYIVFLHQGAHGTISQNRRVNQILAEIGSILTLTNSREHYSNAHLGRHHHRSKLATPEDPDMRFLLSLGFKPGQSIAYYWRRFWLTLFNPMYYLHFAWKRIRRNFF
jgi:fatty acid desaturase